MDRDRCGGRRCNGGLAAARPASANAKGKRIESRLGRARGEKVAAAGHKQEWHGVQEGIRELYGGEFERLDIDKDGELDVKELIQARAPVRTRGR